MSMQEDIVLSTRVRLARNFADTPFPGMQTPQQAQQVIDRVAGAVSKSPMAYDFSLTYLKNNTEDENRSMVEQHMISPDLIAHSDSGAVLISRDKSLSIMIGEEDHLRIQAIFNGFALPQALERAFEAENAIAAQAPFAFDETFGYLTACPTNTGTGMRASCMLHLPALTMTHQIEAVTRAVGTLGFAVRGFYGEGSKARGCLYQLSNQITLGRSEEEIVRALKDTANQVIDREAQARRYLAEKSGAALKDRLLRSYGVLTWACQLSSDELLQMWSDLRLALSLGYLTCVSAAQADALLLLQPATLTLRAKTEMTPAQRDIFRAQCVKNILKIES
jgi:protein arginine kinase